MTATRLPCALALCSLVALASCAGGQRPAPGSEAALHLCDTNEDFARLGLDRTIVRPWEDGRRSPRGDAWYEWWYFDGLLEDGTVIVAWIGDNWPFGSKVRHVSLEITPPGKPTREALRVFAEAGTWSKEQADARVGPHSFSGALESYHIVVDPAETGGLGIDLQLRRTVPSWRPATGVVAAGERYFAWLVAVPEGTLSGTLTMDGTSKPVRGSGYHDHNWGNVSPAELMDSWWWGRAVVGGRTVIASELRGKDSVGGGRIPLYFVSTANALEVSAWDPADIKVLEGPQTRHPDPLHRNTIGSSIAFASRNGFEARFPIADRLLTSSDFLLDQSIFARALAGLAGLRPWYSRFVTRVSVDVPGVGRQSGSGTLEYFEFK